MNGMTTRLLAVAALLAAACHGGSGKEAPRARDVEVTRLVTTWDASGAKEIAADSAVTAVAALVADEAGNVQRIEGLPTSGGHWRIPAVPAGTYTVELRTTGTPPVTYYVSSADALDLGIDRLGRRPTYATASTPVTFTLGGLAPWSDGDLLQLSASDAWLWQEFYPASLAGGDVAAAEVLDFAGDEKSVYGTAWRTPLLAAGDELWVVQLRPQALEGLPSGYATAVAAGAVSGTATPDGEATALPVALASPSSSGTFAIDWRTSQFAALMTGEATQHGLYVSAAPAPLTYPSPVLDGMTMDLLEAVVDDADIQTASGDLSLGTVAYGRFLPGAYHEFRAASAWSFVRRTVPGTAAEGWLSETIDTWEAMAATATPIAPRVGPARNVSIGGRPATAPLTAVGPAPSITWLGTVFGTVRQYELVVHEIAPSPSDETRAITTPVARIVTAATSAKLPVGVLQTGHAYVLEIRARSSPGEYDRAPERMGLPFGQARSFTETFTP